MHDHYFVNQSTRRIAYIYLVGYCNYPWKLHVHDFHLEKERLSTVESCVIDCRSYEQAVSFLADFGMYWHEVPTYSKALDLVEQTFYDRLYMANQEVWHALQADR